MTTHIIQCPRRGKAIVDVARGEKPPAKFDVTFRDGTQDQWERWEWRAMVEHYRSEGCKVIFRGYVTDELLVTHEFDGSVSVGAVGMHHEEALFVEGNGHDLKQAMNNFWSNWNRACRSARKQQNLAVAYRSKRYRIRYAPSG